MKYCIKWNRHLDKRVIDTTDEIMIRYTNTNSSLVNFIKKYQDKRIVVDVIDELKIEDLEHFILIKQTYPDLDFTIALPNVNLDIINKLKEEKIFYFLQQYVCDWDTLIYQINLGVSDMYITEELGFNLNQVSTILHEKNIKIRVFPNVCQTKYANDISCLKTFFIRPEDISQYEPYIDVCEFFGDPRPEFINSVYKAYAIDKEWFGDLSEIIIGFKEPLDNRFIAPRFADKRIRCNRECLKGGKCSICNKIKELSENLKKANMLIKYDNKDKQENAEDIMKRLEEKYNG